MISKTVLLVYPNVYGSLKTNPLYMTCNGCLRVEELPIGIHSSHFLDPGNESEGRDAGTHTTLILGLIT